MSLPPRIGKYQNKEYIKAFCEFAECRPSEIKIRRMDGHAVILHNGTTYLVSHFDDFKEDFRSYFERYSYDEISTQINPYIWEEMLNEIVDIKPDELIVSIYRYWKLYWSDKKETPGINPKHIDDLQQKDFRDLTVLFETIKINPANAVKHANNLGADLIAPIALAVKDSYESFDEFLDDAVGLHVEYGADFLTYGETWEEVLVGGNDQDPGELFYIYNPMWEFEDMEEG
jgi:hypothetical protein